MSKTIIEDTILTSLADKIREKLGVTDTFLPSAMDDKIGEISAGEGVYAWKKYDSDGNFVEYVLDDEEGAYPESGTGDDGYVYEFVTSKKVYDWSTITWADGTDEEIAAMVAAADAGDINLNDYWSVGDTRSVNLSAIAKTSDNAAQEAQTVELVLMHDCLNANNTSFKLNTTLANGRTKPSFVVGQKDSLKAYDSMHGTITSSIGWNGCSMRSWCNSVYKNAFPLELQTIFKEFKTIGYINNVRTESIDTFAIPAEKEVIGQNSYANASESAEAFQFEWYKTNANCIKKINGTASHWCTRSPRNDSASYWVFISNTGYTMAQGYTLGGISPFGVI